MIEVDVVYSDTQESEFRRGSKKSAGYDIAIDQIVNLRPGQTDKICTGTAIQIPDGYYGKLVPRSGSAKLKYALANTIGIIDGDYTDYVKVFITNNSQNDFIAYPGDYLFQIVFEKFEEVKFNKKTKLNKTERGANGFGSTEKRIK
jgi:dUTP pyrophosphatase